MPIVIFLILVIIAGCEQWIHSQPYLAGVAAATEVVQHAVDFEHFGSLIPNIKLTGQRVAFSGECRYLLKQFDLIRL